MPATTGVEADNNSHAIPGHLIVKSCHVMSCHVMSFHIIQHSWEKRTINRKKWGRKRVNMLEIVYNRIEYINRGHLRFRRSEKKSR